MPPLRPDAFTIVHLNDVAAIESVAYLIQFDSVHGTWAPRVTAGSDGIITITEGDRKLEVPYSCCKKLEELKDVKVGGLGQV
jgi:glyceraldehyde 3-phosphate dehydrogenase